MYEMVLKLDDIGKPAWIALMVVAFIIWWPLGLAILAFLLWSGRMGCGRYGDMSRWQSRMADRWDRKMERWGREARAYASSGNRAFDEYREETLRRLEEEQREFRDFLHRLKSAKDKEEFDQFMSERRNRPASDPGTPSPAA
jgi:hypothetical protein